MTKNQQTFIRLKLIMVFLFSLGLTVISVAGQPAPLNANQNSPLMQQGPIPDQVHSITGTVLIQDESGNRTYFLDTNGDGTEDYFLDFSSSALSESLLNSGERVTVTGLVHGQTIDVRQIQKQ